MTATLTRERVQNAAWWHTGRQQWLEVTLETARGGATDGYTARDYIGPGSWEHNGRAYLTQHDADRWLAATGISELDVPVKHRNRKPDGYMLVRDADRAELADGGDGSAWFARLEAGRWDDDEDEVPVPVEPPPEVVPVVGCMDAAPRIVARNLSKAERRQANRALAAEVRALGLMPNGQVWERAKALYAAGKPITSETMEVTS